MTLGPSPESRLGPRLVAGALLRVGMQTRPFANGQTPPCDTCCVYRQSISSVGGIPWAQHHGKIGHKVSGDASQHPTLHFIN